MFCTLQFSNNEERCSKGNNKRFVRGASLQQRGPKHIPCNYNILSLILVTPLSHQSPFFPCFLSLSVDCWRRERKHQNIILKKRFVTHRTWKISIYQCETKSIIRIDKQKVTNLRHLYSSSVDLTDERTLSSYNCERNVQFASYIW